jgi:5'-deoxynucleotidase YfbR-like HD superfamily hydrolase
MSTTEKLVDCIGWLYDGADTTRFHGRRILEPQRVGQHSLRVALLLLLMSDQYGTGDGTDYTNETELLALLRRAATHDLAEHMGTVGDVPSPAKHHFDISAAYDEHEENMLRQHSGLLVPELSERLEQRFKVADILDGMLTCARERQLGNTTLGDMYDNYASYLNDLPLTAVERKMTFAVSIIWRKANGSK